MQTTPLTAGDVLKIVLFFLWLPFALILGIIGHFVEARDVPFGFDLLLVIVRSTTNLPLSLKRRAINLVDVKQILASPRFISTQQELCKRVEHKDFAGYWICQGSLNQKASLSDCDIVLFWIHGGAYVLGDPLMSLVQILRISEILQAKGYNVGVFSLQYGLAPEHTFPEPFEQGLAAYKYVSQLVDPRKIVICGESAGGHLAMTILDKLAQQSIPKPLGALLLFPWVDLSNSGGSVIRNRNKDMLSANDLNRAVTWACGKAGASAFADNFNYSTLRPRGHWKDVLPSKTWVGVGSHDLFVDSVNDFVRNAQDDGCDIALDIWPGKIHGHPAVIDALSRRQYVKSQPAEDVGSTMQGASLIADALLDVVSARSTSQ